MGRFSADWLALREPVDAASRNQELTARLCDWRRGQGNLSVLDLGSGAGANGRFLAPLLGSGQHWRLVDHDPALLARIAPFPDCHGLVRLDTICLDLAGSWAALDIPQRDIVVEIDGKEVGRTRSVYLGLAETQTRIGGTYR